MNTMTSFLLVMDRYVDENAIFMKMEFEFHLLQRGQIK